MIISSNQIFEIIIDLCRVTTTKHVYLTKKKN